MINNKYIKLLMEDNNIVEGEAFEVVHEDGELNNYSPHKIINNELINKYNDSAEYTLSRLFSGFYSIEKLPFVPKDGEVFWYVKPSYADGYNYEYGNSTIAERLLPRGVTPYRTEAEVKAKVKELGWWS